MDAHADLEALAITIRRFPIPFVEEHPWDAADMNSPALPEEQFQRFPNAEFRSFHLLDQAPIPGVEPRPPRAGSRLRDCGTTAITRNGFGRPRRADPIPL